jgi:hypothetical protein
MHRPLLLKCARIVDTMSGEVGEPLDLLIIHTHIQEIRKNINEEYGDVQELDCHDKFVIPGLFDCHTHLAALVNQPEEVQKEIFEECEIGQQFQQGQLDKLVLSDFVGRGITQIRDLGGPVNILRDLRETATSHAGAGPDIFYAGPMLEMPPLRGQQMNERWPGWTVAIKSAQDAQDIVESLVKDGVVCIKAFGKFEDEVLKSLVNQAGLLSLPVTCDPGSTFFHAITVEKGIDLGIRCFEHAKSLWCSVLKDELKKEHDEVKHKSPETQSALVQKLLSMDVESISISKLNKLTDRIVESHTLLCPTLNIFKFYSEKPEVYSDKEPEKFIPTFKALFKVGCFIVSELAKRGVRMLVGQDGYIPRFTYNEMDLLSQNGVNTIEILRGATCYPARWLGVDDKYGSIAVGKKANLVILNENPIDDIRNIRSIFAVLRGGEIVPGSE